MVHTLSLEDAENMVNGAQILATGGGGDFFRAKEKIEQIYADQKQFKIQRIDEFKPNDMICIIGEVGGGISSEDVKYVENLEKLTDNVMIEAVNGLEDHLGMEFSGFVSTEMGPGNIVVPLEVSSLMNRVVVDGDMCGRSKPMISISTSRVADISITPLSIANVYGDRIILKKSVSDKRAEDICRVVSRISNGSIGVARCPMIIKDAKRAVISGTISEAIRLGESIKNANKYQHDIIPVIEREVNAHLVFIGTVVLFTRVEEGGFTSGIIKLKSEQSTLKLWYKNEYLLSWIDEKPFFSCPDSILAVNRLTGEGLSPWTNAFQEENLEVAVFLKPSAPIWRTRKGLKIFGPQIFDKNWKYKPYNP
ncbi:MAG: DUF917 domain-containing protein [Candidatus Hodarchaeales archaeon]|jgi:DUF917 family protein